MISVIVNNSDSKIQGLTAAQFKVVRDLTSYSTASDVTYFRGQRRVHKRYLLTKRCEFPTGILYIILNHLKSTKTPHKVTDLRIEPIRRFKTLKAKLAHTPHTWQKMAAIAVKRKGRGIVVAPTGTGKSLAVILMIEALQVPTLVVVPSLELKHQLTASLKEAFGASKVGDLSQQRVIAVENVQALEPKKVLKGYDCVITDEFHHSGAATYRELNKYAWVNVFYRLGTTATPFRSNEDERLLLESVLSEVIYRLDYRTAVDKGYIVPLEAYYIELPTREIKGNENNWHSMYQELVVNNHYRNERIAWLLETLSFSGASAICLVKEIAHGEQIKARCPFDPPFVTGEDKESKRAIALFNRGEVNVIIGTTGVLGEGVDTKPCEYVIIAGLGKSKNAFMQACGRAFRKYRGKESAKVIILLDRSHKWTKAHFAAQCKHLKQEYGVIPVKL